MARFSTGLRNAMAGYYGLGILMNAGVIRVYNGVIPDTPDAAPGATEIGRITTGGLDFVPGNDTVGAGLIVMLVSPGGLMKSGEWRLKGRTPGTATWWRWCWAGVDPLTESTYYPRVDGEVGSELVLASTTITAMTDVEIETFLMQIGMGG